MDTKLKNLLFDSELQKNGSFITKNGRIIWMNFDGYRTSRIFKTSELVFDRKSKSSSKSKTKRNPYSQENGQYCEGAISQCY